MKTISKITGTQNELTNFVAGMGLILVALLISSFAVMAVLNGIKPF